MPEGDTIFRAARTLRAALEGREVTAVRTTAAQVRALGPQRLVGQTVAAVESRGKHLLIWFSPSDLALHTHLRMSGSWHTAGVGERPRRPLATARLVLEAGAVVATCYAAPVVELLSRSQVGRHPSLAALGPDALADDVDLDEARRRLDRLGGVTLAEALLDQRVLAQPAPSCVGSSLPPGLTRGPPAGGPRRDRQRLPRRAALPPCRRPLGAGRGRRTRDP